MVRKKYVALTPEEWVRQHLIHYLSQHLSYPHNLMRVEKTIPNKQRSLQRQRVDILVYNPSVHPCMIIECKAPTHKLTLSVRTQVMRYNAMQVPFLLFTNGLHHFCFKKNIPAQGEQASYQRLAAIPTFKELISYGHVS